MKLIIIFLWFTFSVMYIRLNAQVKTANYMTGGSLVIQKSTTKSALSKFDVKWNEKPYSIVFNSYKNSKAIYVINAKNELQGLSILFRNAADSVGYVLSVSFELPNNDSGVAIKLMSAKTVEQLLKNSNNTNLAGFTYFTPDVINRNYFSFKIKSAVPVRNTQGGVITTGRFKDVLCGLDEYCGPNSVCYCQAKTLCDWAECMDDHGYQWSACVDETNAYLACGGDGVRKIPKVTFKDTHQ